MRHRRHLENLIVIPVVAAAAAILGLEVYGISSDYGKPIFSGKIEGMDVTYHEDAMEFKANRLLQWEPNKNVMSIVMDDVTYNFYDTEGKRNINILPEEEASSDTLEEIVIGGGGSSPKRYGISGLRDVPFDKKMKEGFAEMSAFYNSIRDKIRGTLKSEREMMPK